MAAGKWRARGGIGAVLFAILIQVINGYEEIYTISQLSPKSASDERSHQDVVRTQVENIAFRIEPSAKYDDQLDFTPENIIDDVESENHIILERSIEPSRGSRSINVEEIPSTNNNEIDNEIQSHNKRKYYEILPTKTIDYYKDDGAILLSSGFGDKLDFKFPGEGKRAPKGRALAPSEPKIRASAVQPIFATATLKEQGRQNTEIQNIITGIVKLLNGNVNVQANSQLLNGRPRPMASRINNRGPPRISDVPPMPDYDKPITPPTHSFLPTKTPPPYPFDRPHGVNLPDQIGPPMNRPFHRPIPPWQRRPRPPNRRPNPALPIYKPTLPPLPDIPDIEEEEEMASENESHSENKIHHDEFLPHITVETTTELKNVTEASDSELTTDTASTSTTTTESTTTSTEATTKTTERVTETTPKATTEKQTESSTRKTEKTTQTTTERTETTVKTTEKPKDKKKDTFDKEKKDNFKLNEVTEKPIKNDTIIDIIQPSMSEVTPGFIIPTPTETLGGSTASESSVSVAIEKTSINTQPIPTSPSIPYSPYRPRPGIVLDDTDFKPHGTRFRPEASVITADTRLPGYGEIFDVTVSAIQGPGEKGGAVHIENINIHENHDDIIVSPSGEQGFVSIDGKRTYLNLFDTTSSVSATRVQTPQHTTPPQLPASPAMGTGVAIPADDVPPPPRRPQHRPQQAYRRPQPTVRIDTCIVGDDSTCDQAQNEKCRTEAGISSCQCRPGYARRTHRDPCRRVVSLLLNLRVDRLYDRKVAWDDKLADKDSDPYQQLSYEAVRAIDSAFSMTPFSDDFVSGSVNSIHHGDVNNRGVFVNYTVLMQETPETQRAAVATDIQKHLLGVIRRRSNNVGASALWVDSPAGSVLPLRDVDECTSPDLNDCHKLATCTNTWGAFKCTCPDTTLDPAVTLTRAGRECKQCSASHCNERGACNYSNGQPYCSCSSGYYGSTFSCRGVTLEERMRWAQIAEAMAQANHYQPEPAQMATRPSSAMFGYPTLPPVPLPRMGLHGPHNGTLNMVNSRANSHHNLYGYTSHLAADSTSSEASSHVQDRADLLVPRPKSRARSMHNQTGIYYDVDYENAPEPIYGTKGIPLSTYTVSRGPPFYR
ncbi:uncharacterized protein LOC119836379 [Zerene cesonia]|uniref:uncharacterized protein LOC119836379 n=1 Tax=Zerene cesonia TaxID=33412 RepID=UPI0018E4E4AD|nr:uncharacterized protein LOC119836379 [Zerene cesonia]